MIAFRCQLRLAALLLALTPLTASGADAAVYFDETQATTLFAFDDLSIPLTQNLRVAMRAPQRHPANPVVPRGPADAPDSWAVQFYGSIIRDQGKFRLWYVAAGADRGDRSQPRSAPWRVAYAESADGVNWVKPKLGLVDYRGSRDNNLLLVEPAPLGILNLKVLHEPDEPDPARRYKMTTHVWFSKGGQGARFGTLVPFVSADGLRWKSVRPFQPVAAEITRDDLFLPWIHFEPAGGLYKWDGIYYASGQNANVASRPYHGRIVRAYASGDFTTWTHASTVGFIRPVQHTLLGPGRSRDGVQTHEGVSVWHRGNVLLGIYGRWSGAPEWAGVTIDLGFVLSNDGLSFREPAHEWTMLARGPDGAWDQGGLLQGQGFENIGELTHLYYGAWDARRSDASPPRGGVGIATLPRDRFGDLVVEASGLGAGDYQLPAADAVCEFITAPVPIARGQPARFHLNADGVGPRATLKVELLGADLQPLPGFSGTAAAVMRRSGFQVPLEWSGRTAITGLPDRVRLRVAYEGARRQDLRVSALYVQPGARR
ncbi:MAG: hypothetical protein JNL39_04035 [Opitutaceae bacterium]|nr:hypothetical protein [Opitutaceae bacterium]